MICNVMTAAIPSVAAKLRITLAESLRSSPSLGLSRGSLGVFQRLLVAAIRGTAEARLRSGRRRDEFRQTPAAGGR